MEGEQSINTRVYSKLLDGHNLVDSMERENSLKYTCWVSFLFGSYYLQKTGLKSLQAFTETRKWASSTQIVPKLFHYHAFLKHSLNFFFHSTHTHSRKRETIGNYKTNPYSTTHPLLELPQALDTPTMGCPHHIKLFPHEKLSSWVEIV